jgi:hypothetical protein
LPAIGTSRAAQLIWLADRTSDWPFHVVDSVAEFSLRRKPFDGHEISNRI